MSSKKETVVYITREIERALGKTPDENYLIVSNRTPYGESVRKQYPKYITLIKDEQTVGAGTGDLMKHTETKDLWNEVETRTGSKPYALVFKNTARIEPLAKEAGWTLLNPPAMTSEKVENKISQIHWLTDLEKYLPPHRIEFLKNIKYVGNPFIIQWAHGHTGGGTVLINSDEELQALKARFPERRSRLTAFVDGPSFTVNVIVTPERIIPSSISYQITGLQPFTDARFATIGNDWGLANKILTPEDRQWIQTLSLEIGQKMQKEFWRGLFGIDVMKNTKTGKMYLIEINARQPASTTFESTLQKQIDSQGSGITTFEAHLSALLGQPVMKELIPVKDGAQIIQRVTKTRKTVDSNIVSKLRDLGLEVITYDNSDDNSDLIRIQSRTSILDEHGVLNTLGESIKNILSQ